jgi:hypothetical protein
MSLASWHRRFRASWQALSHLLWPVTPEGARLQLKAALADELHRRHQRLVRIRQRLERWQGRLQALTREEERLTRTIRQHAQEGKEEDAYATALGLERLRGNQVRLSERIARGEAAYQRQQARFQEVKSERRVQDGG